MPMPTPGVSTPVSREWDSQSIHSDSVASSSTAPLNATGSPALGQGTTVELIRDLVMKRMITLTYMRNVHEGRSHWFHTIMMSKADLERVFNNVTMKKRTYRFAILGMSLSNLFEISNAQDLLRGLLGTLAEYEQAKEENYKPKIRIFRRPAKKLPAGDFALSYQDNSEQSYLVTPQMPFGLDYHQTLLSLLDILSEMYNKISKILGPSPISHPSQQMMGPLGMVSAHPGVSYLFHGEVNHHHENDDALWWIANGQGVNVSGHNMNGGALMSPPPAWTPALGEMILKVDGKLKKIISTLLKELDAFARNSIKDELASLDPLLRNKASTEDGREQYDFEGV